MQPYSFSRSNLRSAPFYLGAFERFNPRWAWLLAMLATLWLGGCASLPDNVERPVSAAFAEPAQTPLGRLVQARRGVARSESGFTLLDGVEPAFGARMALIAAARRSLDLQYYAIHADSSTEEMLSALRDAARRGVRIRILLDDFNTSGRNAQVLRLGFEPNIELRLFNPLPGSRGSMIGRILGSIDDVAQIQQRMHNKLFIADNAMGITGGRNIGDAYFGQGQASNFVDLDVLAAGSVVRDMSASFDRYWNNDLSYPVQSLTTIAQLDALNARANAAKPAAPAAEAAAPGIGVPQSSAASVTGTGSGMATAPGTSVLPDTTATTAFADVPLDLRRLTLTWAPAVLLVDKPGKISAAEDEAPDAQDTLVDGVLRLMTQARSDLLIVSPYFVPGQNMMKVFSDLRTRGVRVRVLTNSLASNDAPIAHVGYARYRKQLLDIGVELFEMRSEQSGSLTGFGSTGSKSGSSRASLHSKVLIMDSRLIVVGSMNLDLRSQLQNTEVALVIRSLALSRQATEQIESTLKAGAYRMELGDGKLMWRAPPGAAFKDSSSEPDASRGLQLMLKLIGPLAPDEML